MSTTTNMHHVAHITVTEFEQSDQHPAFTRIKFADDQGNDVTIFPEDMTQFVADISAAVKDARRVTS